MSGILMVGFLTQLLISALTGQVGTRSSMWDYPDQDLCRHLSGWFDPTEQDQGVSFSERFGPPLLCQARRIEKPWIVGYSRFLSVE
jgi:hypothetical protein